VTLGTSWPDGAVGKRFLLVEPIWYNCRKWEDDDDGKHKKPARTRWLKTVPLSVDNTRDNICQSASTMLEQVMIQHQCKVDVGNPSATTHCMAVSVNRKLTFKHCTLNGNYEVFDRTAKFSAVIRRWPARPPAAVVVDGGGGGGGGDGDGGGGGGGDEDDINMGLGFDLSLWDGAG
jgi:hypothetical protein